MKKLFVSSDIHSFYDEWMKSLKEAEFDINNKDHVIIVCGDILDRGDKSNECLKFVLDLPEDRRVLIRGNHELLMDEIIYRKKYFDPWDYSNGTVKTIEHLTGISDQYDGVHSGWVIQQTMIEAMKAHEVWNKYYNDTVMYAEIGDYIFVHGWIPGDSTVLLTKPPQNSMTYRPNWREAPYWDWKDATWLNGMQMWQYGVREPGKTIVCGHWHSSWGHHKIHMKYSEFDKDALFTPFEDEGIINLDGCTAHSGIVNVKVLEVTNDEWENYYNNK